MLKEQDEQKPQFLWRSLLSLRVILIVFVIGGTIAGLNGEASMMKHVMLGVVADSTMSTTTSSTTSSTTSNSTTRGCTKAANNCNETIRSMHTNDGTGSSTTTTTEERIIASPGMCQFFEKQGATSFPDLVRHLQPLVVRTTMDHLLSQVYISKKNGKPNVAAQNKLLIQKALERLMHFWDATRIRKSLIHAMPLPTAKLLVDILNKRILYSAASDDESAPPPLRIMVVGGSIAMGVNSDMFDLSENITKLSGDAEQARYSNQLGALFNQIVTASSLSTDTPVLPVVEVTNMATGGMTSDVGSAILEYALWPPEYPRQGPDMVIAAYAFNDIMKFIEQTDTFQLKKKGRASQVATDDDENHRKGKAVFKSLEEFLEKAYSNRCDDLPAVVMIDDSFLTERMNIPQNLLHSQVVSDLATWHALMALSYTRAMVHTFYADLTLTDHEHSLLRREQYGLNEWNIHPGLLFHVSIGWMIFFQLLETIYDYCSNEAADLEHVPTTATSDVENTPDGLNPRHIPPLESTSLLTSIGSDWRKSASVARERCSDPAYEPGNTCSHYWLVHKATKWSRKEDVTAAIGKVKTYNNDWLAEGYPIRTPRPGFVAQKANASFGITVTATEFPIRKVSVHFMKSYGDKWKDSRMQVRLSVPQSNDNSTTAAAAATDPVVVMGEIEGSHNSPTSVFYEESFGVNVAVGGSIEASFTLVGGTTFKITGMFFCAR